jgi:hypothetical protein
MLNKQEQSTAAMERLGKHVPTEMDMKMNGVFCADQAEEL